MTHLEVMIFIIEYANIIQYSDICFFKDEKELGNLVDDKKFEAWWGDEKHPIKEATVTTIINIYDVSNQFGRHRMKRVFPRYIDLILWLCVGSKEDRKNKNVLGVSESNINSWVDNFFLQFRNEI